MAEEILSELDTYMYSKTSLQQTALGPNKSVRYVKIQILTIFALSPIKGLFKRNFNWDLEKCLL